MTDFLCARTVTVAEHKHKSGRTGSLPQLIKFCSVENRSSPICSFVRFCKIPRTARNNSNASALSFALDDMRTKNVSIVFSDVPPISSIRTDGVVKFSGNGRTYAATYSANADLISSSMSTEIKTFIIPPSSMRRPRFPPRPPFCLPS